MIFFGDNANRLINSLLNLPSRWDSYLIGGISFPGTYDPGY